MALPVFREIEELVTPVTDLPLISGQIIFCSDTGNLYKDGASSRIKMSNGIILISTLIKLNNIVDPQEDKLYIVLEDVGLYVYNGGVWNHLNKKSLSYYRIDDIVLGVTSESNGYKIFRVNDINIKEGMSLDFIPDPSVSDMITDISVTAWNGYINISYKTAYPSYTLFGHAVLK